LYSFLDIIRIIISLAGHAAHVQIINAHKILMGIPEGKRSLGRSYA
jgi:hypothetical protein